MSHPDEIRALAARHRAEFDRVLLTVAFNLERAPALAPALNAWADLARARQVMEVPTESRQVYLKFFKRSRRAG